MPGLASRKDIIKWLTDSYSIYYAADAPKNELSDIIKLNNPTFKTFSFDRILAQQEHIQCLPPYHLELNTAKKKKFDLLQKTRKMQKCNFQATGHGRTGSQQFFYLIMMEQCQCTHM